MVIFYSNWRLTHIWGCLCLALVISSQDLLVDAATCGSRFIGRLRQVCGDLDKVQCAQITLNADPLVRTFGRINDKNSITMKCCSGNCHSQELQLYCCRNLGYGNLEAAPNSLPNIDQDLPFNEPKRAPRTTFNGFSDSYERI